MRRLTGPVLIFVILALGLTSVGLLITRAVGDRSFGVEPDYYAKGLKWDETAAQRARNQALGWTASATGAGADGGRMSLIVSLVGRDGAAIEGASIRGEAFAHTRSADRVALAFTPTQDGRYVAALPGDAAGLWRVTLSAERDGELFTAAVDAALPAGAHGVAP